MPISSSWRFDADRTERCGAVQPSPATRTRASLVRLGSGGTHSGQLCPYPRSPRVGTLLGMCNDQVTPALIEAAPTNMTGDAARIYATVFSAERHQQGVN